ncbi:iron ABC transporter permease [Kurthia sp. 3B1D]|uniref:Iron ABC transporter permease n=2 Tax=Kurthia TaxID=1649 RepID=A0A433RR32_9BACL|nr:MULTISPECIES: iron chelate uptake ABC transporter family permease subunit [unclassified Kurthia]RUS53245.1 iron ABC transporter permease [Kurthia sp. 3B1D]HIX42553.1 iron chelate uptake ABC transporter family permease subunit [Candidatus Kurthia intestinigallinarum]
MQSSVKKTNTIKILCLAVLAIISIAGFLFYNIQGSFSYAFPMRVYRVAAMVITAVAIAYATVMFQTVTRNRILTPSMIGVDSMYEVVQTVIYFFLGSASIFVVDRYLNFGTAILAMVLFALLLYRFLFRADKYPIFLLLLAGMIIGTLLGSLVSFLQVMIDPVEYLSLQNKLFASFTNVKSELVVISAVILIACFIYGAFLMRDLDVMNLGRDNAMNLGVSYDKMVLRVLILASILIATSTALVGPITFLGLIVSNLAYQFLVTYKHSILILGASLISIIALVGGQFLVLHVFNLNTTISVIINFVGGIYFIYLLLKQSKGVAG